MRLQYLYGEDKSATLNRTKTKVSYRGRPVTNQFTTIVNNTDRMPPIERQLHGTSTVKIFLEPAS
jgi:hypothetical protein